MTPTRIALSLGLCLLPCVAFAQDGFPGQYDLEGRYSNRRVTKAQLKVTKSPDGWVRVERTGKFTSNRFRHLPEFTWTSSSVDINDRLMRVTYVVHVPGTVGAAGLSANLDPDSADRADVVSALTKTNTFSAVYFISADKKSLTEYVVNTTRLGDQRNWLWINTSGDRVVASNPNLSYADYEKARNKALQDWYTDWVTEAYVDDLADPNLTADERRKLEEQRDEDLDFDMVEIMFGHWWFDEDIEERYGPYNPDPFLDANGQVIPKSALEVIDLSMFPNFAGIGLSKAFVFDTRTGEILDEGDIQD
jgi:hypothetical protein